MLKLKDKVIVVTGGTGTIGRVLVSKFKAMKVKTRVWSSKNDIRKKNLINFDGVDYVIHLAAKMNGDKKEIYDTNVLGTRNIFDKAVEAGVKKIVYVSTVMVFADTGDQIRNEEYKKRKRDGSWYADSKIKALRLFSEYKKRLPMVMVYPTVVLTEKKGWLRPGSLMSLVGSGGRITNYIEVNRLADLIIRSLVFGKNGQDYILGDKNIRARDYWWPGKLIRIPNWVAKLVFDVAPSNMAFSSQKINSI